MKGRRKLKTAIAPVEIIVSYLSVGWAIVMFTDPSVLDGTWELLGQVGNRWIFGSIAIVCALMKIIGIVLDNFKLRYYGLTMSFFDHTPHMTVAGTTRFGKTVTLKVLTTYLIENHQDDAEFYIIDLKGGLEFNRHKNLRQVKQVASNPEEAIMLLFTIKQQIEKDYLIFKKKYWTNITNTPIKTRKFIIVDEAASLTAEKWMDKEMKAILGQCQAILSEISRIAGGMGYRLIFATQYPTADTMPRQIKQNSDAKITFRLPSGYASEVAIDDRGAEELPSNIKGRALFKTHELREMQAPYISDEDMWDRVGKYQEATILDMEPDNVVSIK